VKKRIYLDHSATTAVDSRVLKEMLPYFGRKFGNPSSLHSFGQEAKAVLEDARARIAVLLKVRPDEIIFTSGGSESDNLALRGAAHAAGEKGNHIITSVIEHPAVLETCRELEKEGFRITYIPVDSEGIIKLDRLENAVNSKTILVSVMHANNETGTIQPLEKIAAICDKRGVPFHSDAVQSFGKVPIDLGKTPVSMLSLSAHKIYGPKGIGALFVRKGTRLSPQITGGPQESGRRAGTENVVSAAGFARAAELMHAEMKRENERLSGMRDYLIRELTRIEDSRLNGHPRLRLAGNLNITFRYVEGESLLALLDIRGIAASTGSACSSASLKASHVLLAMGLKHAEAHGSLRLTLGRENKKSEMPAVVSAVAESVSHLRKLSPLAKKP
jgi:cysteine desulfurase